MVVIGSEYENPALSWMIMIKSHSIRMRTICCVPSEFMLSSELDVRDLSNEDR